MMSTLVSSTARELEERFYLFNDSLLRKLEITYEETGKRRVVAWVATRDSQATEDDGWVCVRLTILGAQEYRFREAKNTSAQVLSHGIHVCWFDGVVGVDFGHFVDPPNSLAELLSSEFFVTGASLDWTVEPY